MTFDNLSIRQLKYVLTLSVEKNFTRAAEKLFITQPSLSQAIKNIEDENGVTLFTRGKRCISLTREGELFVKYAENILRSITDLNTSLNHLRQTQQDALTVGAGFTLGNVYLSRMIGEYRKRFPKTALSLVEADSNALEREAREGSIDISFVLLPVSDPNLKSITISSGDLVIGMSMSNSLVSLSLPAEDDGLRWFDIENARDASFVRFLKGGRIESLMTTVLRECRFSPKDSIRVRNVSSAIDIIAQSDDIVILPDIYTKSNRQSAKCCFFRIKDIMPKWSLAAVSATEYSGMSAAAKHFIDLLTAHGSGDF